MQEEIYLEGEESYHQENFIDLIDGPPIIDI